MRRRIRKEDIGGPSNFVHVQHVGFGHKSAPLTSQRSLDLGGENNGNTTDSTSGNNDDGFKVVERRAKPRRQSQIPRHHRSTTAGFPENNSRNSPQENEMLNQGEREPERPSESSLKPTFGSLLNLSFLPLGLGKSSSKSSSVNKTKRMSLLNLTASNLFANPKEEKRGSVHMTGYFRRRSISSPTEDEDGMSPPIARNSNTEAKLSSVIAKANSSNNSSMMVPLAKLGRSKSTMSEFSKRPKLRLKIVPPTAPPPLIPVVHSAHIIENLPSPPPSPVPSPPSTPLTAPPIESPPPVVLRRPPKSPPRSRIIPLPSTTDSVDSGPTSPQYLTPAGGCSPQPSEESAFPLLSPTLPPTITPLYTSQRFPGTPPIWPLQPVWPAPNILMQQTEATIPELPSPSKDEMETSEYEPVLEIVESFMTEKENNSMLSQPSTPAVFEEVNVPEKVAESTWHANFNTVNAANIEQLGSILRDSVQYKEWPSIAQTLFQGVPTSTENDDGSDHCRRVNEIYGSVLTKTLEMWVEMAGDHATVDALANSLSDMNPLAADLVRQVNLEDTK